VGALPHSVDFVESYTDDRLVGRGGVVWGKSHATAVIQNHLHIDNAWQASYVGSAREFRGVPRVSHLDAFAPLRRNTPQCSNDEDERRRDDHGREFG
jgi:hypothetical protein